jgi:hypothetical protein
LSKFSVFLLSQEWNVADDSCQVLGYIKEVEYFGLTGEIMFDADGFRTNFKLDLMEKFHNRMKKSAIWTEKGERRVRAEGPGAQVGSTTP